MSPLRFILGMLLLAVVEATAADYVLPTERKIDWSTCGGTRYSFGTTIPSTNGWTVYTNGLNALTNDTGSAQTLINTWVDAAAGTGLPSIIYLPGGTYRITDRILLDKSNVRIIGYPHQANTDVRFHNVLGEKTLVIGAFDVEDPNGVADLTSGYNKGSTLVVVDGSDTNSSFTIGQFVVIDQTQDGTFVDAQGTEGFCTGCSRASGTRTLAQRNRIVAISGNNVTLEEPLMYQFSSARSPQITWWSQGTYVTNSGVENVTIDYTDGTDNNEYSSAFTFASLCWFNNVKTIEGGRGHIQVRAAYKCTVFGSHLSLTAGGGTQTYGIELHHTSSHNLFENNIFESVSGMFIFAWSSSANVFSYNYCTNVIAGGTELGNAISFHDAHSMFQLLEGNVLPCTSHDNYHGSTSHATIFRNRILGKQPSSTSQNQAITMWRNSGWTNSIIGNVLGLNSHHNAYRLQNTSSDGGLNWILKFGYADNDLDLTDYDTMVTNSLLILQNYNYADDAIPASEAIGADPLPASFYLSEKPAWFGFLNYPWLDPTNQANYNVTNLPAGYRFIFGTNPPAGAGGGGSPTGPGKSGKNRASRAGGGVGRR